MTIMSKCSRRNILRSIAVVPFAGIFKLPENVTEDTEDTFEPFHKEVGGMPYISGIVNEPPEKINGISYPGRLRITCTMKHDNPYNNGCFILEHLTWEHLYDDEEQMELGVNGYMACKQWFAQRLYEASKIQNSLQHVPEFSTWCNPVKLKLSCIEYCSINKKSGRLLS